MMVPAPERIPSSALPPLADYTFTPAPRREFSPYLDELKRRAMESRPELAPLGSSTIPEHARDPISQAAAKHNVPLPLAAALAKQESGFDPNARGTSGERGMYQLLPSSFREYSPAELDESFLNADLGVGYLRERYDQYRSRARTDAEGWSMALTAYNWGMGRIAERTDPTDTAAEVLSKAPSSTQEHQANVLKYAREFGRSMRAASRETVDRPALAGTTFTPAPRREFSPYLDERMNERMQRDLAALRPPQGEERMREELASVRSPHLDERMRRDLEANATLGQSTPLTPAERRATEESRLAALNLKVDISPLDIIQRNEAGEPVSHHQAPLSVRRMTGPRQSVNLKG